MAKAPPADEDWHGSVPGYKRHLKQGQPPCLACRRANSLSSGRSHARGKCAKGLGWPLREDWQATVSRAP